MAEQGHQVIIETRNNLRIRGGVKHVHSFDSDRIILETSHGFMDIYGDDLYIEELNLEDGSLVVVGDFSALKYSQDKSFKGKGKSVLSRILK
ncbi:MAG: sporulation protein YabP [Clostridia bacterium]|nr:sporulation protein YabP [Clostridia bacterium]